MIRLHLKKQICMEGGCMLDKWFADLNDMHKMVQLYFRNKQYKTLKLYIQRFEKILDQSQGNFLLCFCLRGFSSQHQTAVVI